jgi:hypothetical protein
MNKITLTVLAILALAWAGCPSAMAQENVLEGEVTVGGAWTLDDIDDDEDGALGGVEYESVVDKDLTVDLGADLSLRTGGVAFDGQARYRDGDDQEYSADLSLERILIYKTDYNRFLHRLDHDELANLEGHVFDLAANGGGGLTVPELGPAGTIGSAAVYHTDHNPMEDYSITRSEWNNGVTFHIPMMPALTLGFDHRLEKRQGCAQALTTSKCSACHIEGYSQDIHEVTNDYMPRASLRLGAVGVEYSYLHREFRDKSDDMEQTYNGLAVPSHLNAFVNRLQFANVSGSLPFEETPDSMKDTHTLKARWDLNPQNVLTGGVIYSKSTNQDTDGSYDPLTGQFGRDLELDSTSVMAKWHSRFSRTFSFNVQGTYQTLDGDDVYVDVYDDLHTIALAPDSTAPANRELATGYGLPAGYWDFARKSGYDRDVVTAGLDASWRLLTGVTLHGGYEFRYVDRENGDEYEVPSESKEHTLNVAGDWRINRGLKLRLDYTLSLTDDAYAMHKAVCTQDVSGMGYAGPGTALYDYPRSYYPAIYDARTGTRSNVPNTTHEIKIRTSWNPVHLVSTSLYAKYRMAKNDEVDGDDWQQDMFTGGINVVLTPNDKMVFAAGYNYFNDKYESMFCIAIYDG